MNYSPTITAIMGLNNSHDSVLYKIAEAKCPASKSEYQRQELQIMSCLFELLDSLPEKDKSQTLEMINRQ